MSEGRAALFRLARELRYRPLPIIGQQVVIEAVADVEPMLARLAAPWSPAPGTWDGCQIEGGLGKYGLIDRECEVPHEHLEDPSTLHGIRALRVNRFESYKPEADPVADAEARRWADACAITLAETLDRPCLKLFLEDDLSFEQRTVINQRQIRTPGPAYFPRTFTITDACITNAPGIWLGKHFYL